MDPAPLIAAISGWVVAAATLAGCVVWRCRIVAGMMHTNQIRAACRDFMLAAREIDNRLLRGEAPDSPRVAGAAALLEMARFELSVGAPAGVRIAADGYSREVIRRLTEQMRGVPETSDKFARRTDAAEEFAVAVSSVLGRSPNPAPDWFAEALDAGGR